MVQLVFFGFEHLMGSSGGVERTKEMERKVRIMDVKAFSDVLFCRNKGIFERFGGLLMFLKWFLFFCDL